MQDSGRPVSYEKLENISRVDRECTDAEEVLEQSMEFERAIEHCVSVNGSLGEVLPEFLLKNGMQESGCPGEGSDGTTPQKVT